MNIIMFIWILMLDLVIMIITLLGILWLATTFKWSVGVFMVVIFVSGAVVENFSVWVEKKIKARIAQQV